MKQICFGLLLLSLFGGCQKDDVPIALIGDWRWDGSSGGIGGWVIKPNAGELVILRFSVDRQVAVYQHDTLTLRGYFRLAKQHSIYSGKEENAIVIEQKQPGYLVKNARGVVSSGIILALSPDHLSIGDNYYDGYGSSFVRQ